jgi:hypothetical protein
MFDKFKNLIFKEEESTKETATPLVTNNTNTIVTPLYSQPTIGISNTEEISKYQTIIKDVLKENNLEGIDYLEFMNSIQSMEGTGTAENLMYKFAFSSLASVDSKLTKESLLTATNHYIEVINKTKSEFNSTVEQKYFKVSQLKKERVSELDNQILKLQEQINNLNTEKNNNITESVDLLNKGTEKVNYFKMVADSEIETITNNSKKIQQYL